MPSLRAEPYTGHRCRCVVVDSDNGRQDRCGTVVDNPDQPICDPCAERHFTLRELCSFCHFEMAEQ